MVLRIPKQGTSRAKDVQEDLPHGRPSSLPKEGWIDLARGAGSEAHGHVKIRAGVWSMEATKPSCTMASGNMISSKPTC